MFSKRTFRRRNKPRQSTWLESGDQNKENAFIPPVKSQDVDSDQAVDGIDSSVADGPNSTEMAGKEEMLEKENMDMTQNKEEEEEATQSKEEEEEAMQSKEEEEEAAQSKEEEETSQSKEEEEEATQSKEEEEEATQSKEEEEKETKSKESKLKPKDLAVKPPSPEAEAKKLTAEEISDAIAYNKEKFKDEERIKTLRDVLGLSSDVATIDEKFVTTIAQWQAENDLEVNGKIDAKTAAVIGYEMLEESKLNEKLEPEAIRMLEKGIVVSLSNDTYNDTATESRKKIKFSVFIPKGLDMKDYCLVNWNKGFYQKGDGTYYQATDYGNERDVNFASWQVDSVDKDPIYWSEPGKRWDYTIDNQNSFSATDDPGQAQSTELGAFYNLQFKLQVYRVDDVPLTTTGDLGGAESKAITTIYWEYKTKVSETGEFSH